MTIEFTRWPADRAHRYRERGYWLGSPLTQLLTQHLEDPARARATALICGKRQYTYEQLDRLSGNLASHLAACGLNAGSTALVQLPNIAEFYIVLFALLKCGIAPVNALYNHRHHELVAFADQVRPRLLIGSCAHEIFRDDAFLDKLQHDGLFPEVVLLLGQQEGFTDLGEWIERPAAEAARYAASPAEEVALFQLSGGSTGTPKLIPRTHDDYGYSIRASAALCRLSSETRFLCALPAAHNFSLSSPGALGVFHAGGCVILASNPEPLHCFSLIELHEVNMAALVPSAVALWLQAAPAHAAQLRTLALLQVGGASFAESLARRVPSLLGCSLQQVFGMAEGLVNYTRLDAPEEHIFTSQGRPLCPDDEIKIIDERGAPVEDGKPGMLATRGPYTFCGYYRSPEHNTHVFDQDGYYYSGDIVLRTPAGNLRVIGRIKDQINRGGEKIAAEEIENLLMLHPDVVQAALIGIPDEMLGEKSCAVIVSRSGNIRPVAIRRHLMELGIAEYKLPDRVQLIDKMPLTAVGKLDKLALREALPPPQSI